MRERGKQAPVDADNAKEAEWGNNRKQVAKVHQQKVREQRLVDMKHTNNKWVQHEFDKRHFETES